MTPAATTLAARHLFRIRIELHPILTVGDTPMGHRRMIPVSGGTFDGERLKGVIAAHGGADWLLRRADFSFQQDVRLTLQTDDGAIVLMSYRGVRHSSDEVRERLAKGEPVDPREYYLRTAPFFETADPRYTWLNTIVTIGIGEIASGGAAYDVYEIL
jgi:hypothetical protein